MHELVGPPQCHCRGLPRPVLMRSAVRWANLPRIFFKLRAERCFVSSIFEL
jgi:hypothetical protein